MKSARACTRILALLATLAAPAAAVAAEEWMINFSGIIETGNPDEQKPIEGTFVVTLDGCQDLSPPQIASCRGQVGLSVKSWSVSIDNGAFAYSCSGSECFSGSVSLGFDNRTQAMLAGPGGYANLGVQTRVGSTEVSTELHGAFDFLDGLLDRPSCTVIPPQVITFHPYAVVGNISHVMVNEYQPTYVHRRWSLRSGTAVVSSGAPPLTEPAPDCPITLVEDPWQLERLIYGVVGLNTYPEFGDMTGSDRTNRSRKQQLNDAAVRAYHNYIIWHDAVGTLDELKWMRTRCDGVKPGPAWVEATSPAGQDVVALIDAIVARIKAEDLDRDGVSTGAELAARTDPNDPSSF
jgi:hypothetical protein